MFSERNFIFYFNFIQYNSSKIRKIQVQIHTYVKPVQRGTIYTINYKHQLRHYYMRNVAFRYSVFKALSYQ